MHDDLDHLRLVITCRLDRQYVGLADMAALARHFYSEAYCRIRLRVVRGAVAIGCHLRLVELGEVLAQIGVR